jgi:hypothetical protein
LTLLLAPIQPEQPRISRSASPPRRLAAPALSCIQCVNLVSLFMTHFPYGAIASNPGAANDFPEAAPLGLHGPSGWDGSSPSTGEFLHPVISASAVVNEDSAGGGSLAGAQGGEGLGSRLKPPGAARIRPRRDLGRRPRSAFEAALTVLEVAGLCRPSTRRSGVESSGCVREVEALAGEVARAMCADTVPVQVFALETLLPPF